MECLIVAKKDQIFLVFIIDQTVKTFVLKIQLNFSESDAS